MLRQKQNAQLFALSSNLFFFKYKKIFPKHSKMDNIKLI
jgi:hypothetical protein